MESKERTTISITKKQLRKLTMLKFKLKVRRISEVIQKLLETSELTKKQ